MVCAFANHNCALSTFTSHILTRLSGLTYQDVLQIYGLSRAGYIPQLISIQLPNPDVILGLLSKSKAAALIIDTAFAPVTSSWTVPVFSTADVQSGTAQATPEAESEPLPPLFSPRADDIIFIFHTSGSTSGSPKLVPCTRTWSNAAVRKMHLITRPGASGDGVNSWLLVLSLLPLPCTNIC